MGTIVTEMSLLILYMIAAIKTSGSRCMCAREGSRCMYARADNVRNSTLACQREARSTSLLAALVRMCARAGKVAELGTWYHGNAGGDDVVRRDSSAIR